MRPQNGPADADVQDSGNVPECPRFDRIDQRPHPRPAGGCQFHRIGSARTPLREMLGGSAFGYVDDIARKQPFASSGEALFLGQIREGFEKSLVEVGLRPVEIDSGDGARKALKTVRLFSKQQGQRLERVAFDLFPGVRRHQPCVIVKASDIAIA